MTLYLQKKTCAIPSTIPLKVIIVHELIMITIIIHTSKCAVLPIVDTVKFTFMPSSQLIHRSPLVRKHPTACRAK